MPEKDVRPRDKAENQQRSLMPVVLSGVFGVASAVIGGLFVWFAPAKPEPAPVVVIADRDATPSAERQLRDSPVSLTDWQRLAKDLSISPDEKKRAFFSGFVGKRVTWEGYVRHVVDLRKKNNQLMVLIYDSPAALIRAQRPNSLGEPGVRCWFTASAIPQLIELTPGSRVVVNGTIADPTMAGSSLGTDLYDCRILKSDATRIATDPTRTRH